MRTRPRSLARTLLQRYVLAFGAILLLWMTVYLASSWGSYSQDFDGRLEGLAREIAESIVRGADGEPSVRMTPALTEALRAVPTPRFASWNAANGTMVAGSDADFAAAVRREFPADSQRLFRFHKRPAFHGLYFSPSGPMEIALTRGRINFDDFADWLGSTLSEEILPVMLPIMLVTLAIGAVTVRRSLAPLGKAAARVAGIGPAETSTRLDEAGIPVEILPFVRAVNQALERLDRAFAAERRFTADAAHELRTPIAILSSRIDGLGPGEAKRLLQRDVARAGRVVAQLLSMSTLDARVPELVRDLNLAEIGREVVSDLAPRALADHKEIAFYGPSDSVPVTGNPVALADALRNLIDNALRFTPRGQAVTVSIHRDGTIEVCDRGPGVPDEHREAVFRRFWRGPNPGGEGVGLGLAIVAQIAETHDAQVGVEDNPGGGARFWVKLPAAGPSIDAGRQPVAGPGRAA